MNTTTKISMIIAVLFAMNTQLWAFYESNNDSVTYANYAHEISISDFPLILSGNYDVHSQLGNGEDYETVFKINITETVLFNVHSGNIFIMSIRIDT